MLKSADGGLRAVPFPVEDPERIPAKRYYDPEFYQAELDHMWPHAWQMATRLDRIPEVGDWVEYQSVGQSVIVVNTEQGVKAWFNACRHRGVPFAGGKGNDHGNCKAAGFVCPFHGWRFNMDGENTYIYGKHLFSERQLNPDDVNLIPCRVETAIGCAWINFDDDAPSLRDSIGPLIDRLEAHNVHKLKAEWWVGTILPANWKIAMEAFMEGYHVMTTHPQLQDIVPELYDSMYKFPRKDQVQLINPDKTLRENVDIQLESMLRLSDGMDGMLHKKELEIARSLADVDNLGIEFPEDKNMAMMMWLGVVQDQITKRLQAAGEPVPDLNTVCQTDPINAVEFLFPHYFLLPYFSSFSAYRIRPLGPESCMFELWSLTTYPEDTDHEVPMEPTMIPYNSEKFPPIPRQDYSNIPLNQIGLHTKGFEYMRLSKDVEGLVSNFHRLLDGYLAGVPADKLAKANHKLAGNFDGPIQDLEF